MSNLTQLRRWVWLPVVALVLWGAAAAAATPIPNGAEVQFTASFITTPAPSSSFSNTVGGDGWAAAHYNGNVYTVFHHIGSLQVACLNIDAGTPCTDYPKTVQSLDGTPHDFATGEWPSLHVNTTTGTLYTWATDRTALTAGVVGIDLDSTATNPFESYTALTAAGDAMVFPGPKSGTGNGILIGSNWYSFNHYAPSAGWTSTGDQNKLMCFDVSTGIGCPGQPYAVPGLTKAWFMYFSGALTQVGSRLFLELTENGSYSAGSYYCFDTSTNGACTGTWPKASFGDTLYAGAGFPALNAEGAVIGTCMKVTDQTYTDSNFPGNIRCIDADGEDLTAQSTAVGAVINANMFGNYNVSHQIIGTRVYLSAGNDFSGGGNYNSRIMCYDWATNQSCPNFPVTWTDGNSTVGQLYTVGTDPTNPTCLWLLAHRGSKQIQTMDAFTAGDCGVGGARVLMSSFVQPHQSCVPTKYTSLTITSPAPGAYTGGTVTFFDHNGTPLNSLPVQTIDSSGAIDLTSLNLSTSAGLPQMQVNLPGAESSNINMTVRWTANYDSRCDDGGQSVSYTPSSTTTTTGGSGSQTTTTTVKTSLAGGKSQVTNSALPETGSDASNVALYAGVLLAAGCVALGSRRTRRLTRR